MWKLKYTNQNKKLIEWTLLLSGDDKIDLVNLKTDQQNLFNLSNRKIQTEINQQSFSNMWDNKKGANIYIIRVPEGEEKEHGLTRYLGK